MRLMITILMTVMMSAAVQAEVLKSSAEGFIVQHIVNIESDTATVFETMTDKVGQWWSSDHSFSGSAGNMLIDDQCFCERWGGNLVRHLNTVIWLDNSKVVMEGGLGPLKELGLTGTMIWALTASDDVTTTVNWKYHVYGYSDTDLTTLATAVDGVLGEQMDRLLESMK
ncbi:MAG: hypothetical protein GY732_04525 [Gammaproteobacteria bacterium]|nr:hypothetical protein [Gammaproteobacteria bacterium]